MLPDGTQLSGIPDGTPEHVIRQKAIAAGLAKESDFTGVLPKQREPDTVFDKAVGMGEAALAIGSGIVAEPLAGLYGISEAVNPWAESGAGARAVEDAKQALTYQPRSAAGREDLQTVGEFLEPVGEAISGAENWLGETALEATGSPEVAAAAHTLPTAMLTVLGLKGGKAAKGMAQKSADKQTIQAASRLNTSLERRGLALENLKPEALDRLAARLPSLPNKSKAIESMADDIIGANIKAGAKDGAFAKFRAIKDGSRFRLEPDRLAEEVIRQGYDAGFVQSMKAANPHTRRLMREMNTNMKRIKSDPTFASDLRPSNVAGRVITDQIKTIRDKADAATVELKQIADNVLPGKRVNARPVVERFKAALDELKVKAAPTENGLVFDFSKSIIEADKGSQRLIKSAFDVMNKSDAVDSRMLHELKLKLDALIDYNKTSRGGIPEKGRKVLKKVRSSANEAIRDVSPDYARVNDILHESIGTLDDFQDLIGKRIALDSDAAIGQDMRALLSNQKRRVALEDAIARIDSVSRKHGYKGQADIKQLVTMANRLDRRYGAVAENSFQGNIDSALENAVRNMAASGVEASATNMAADLALKGWKKLRHIDDSTAFKAVDDLLKRDN